MAKSFEVLKSQANVIKNETEDGKNTATRVGTMFVDLIESVQDECDDHPVDTQRNSKYDYAVADENGNVVFGIQSGYPKSKNFDGSMWNVYAKSGTYDFCISDENGNIIFSIQNGVIKTKTFDSSNIQSSTDVVYVPTDGSGSNRIRFMHWNIGHYCNGNGTSTGVTSSTYAAKKKAFREVFNKYAADIVGLCEYSSIFYGSETASNAILGQYKYHHIAPTESGYVGLAIHSALQVTNLKEISLGSNTAYEGVIFVGGKKVIICECHLPWNSQTAHDTAMNIILNRYASEPNVIVGGDFNFFVGDSSHTPYTQQYKTWTDAGYQTANCGYIGDLLTSYNNVINTNYLDSIFVKGGSILKTEVHQVTPSGKDANNPQKADETLWDSVNLSDHFPIIAEIVF